MKEIRIIEENRKNPNKFFENSNQIKGFKPQVKILLNENGELVTGKREIVELFKKHFESLMNRQGQGSTSKDMMYHTVEPDIGKPKQKEVARIIEALKNKTITEQKQISSGTTKKRWKRLYKHLT